MPVKAKKPAKPAPKRRIRQIVEEIEVPQTTAAETPTPVTPEPVPETPVSPAPVAPQEPVAPETPPIDFSAETEKPNFFKLFLITIGVALIVAAIAGSLYVYFSGISKTKKQSPSQTPSSTLPPTPTQTPSSTTPSPSPIPAEKLSSLKINILNGSGKIGVASNAKSLVEKVGFKVTSTGNAQTFDFTDTIIQVKGTIDASIVDLLKQALSSNYQVKVGDKLNSSNNFDIVITVGSAGS